MNTAQETVEAAEIVVGLKSQITEHEQVLRGIKARRQKFAFKASQGDRDAITALGKIEADEAGSTSALKNLELAIAEASERLSAAQRVERAAYDEAAREYLATLSQQLVEADVAIVAHTKALRLMLDDRKELVSEICDLGLLDSMACSRLSNPVTVALAVLDELAPHVAQQARFDHDRGAIDRLTYSDARLLGVETERPPESSWTAVQLELQKSIDRPGWRSTGKFAAQTGPSRSVDPDFSGTSARLNSPASPKMNSNRRPPGARRA